MGELPYMPLYVDDLRSSLRYEALDDRAKLLYRELLDLQWRSGGALPPDDRLSKHLHLEAETMAHLEHILDEFFPPADGGRQNARLRREWDRSEEIRRRKSEGGRKSAAKRLGKSLHKSLHKSPPPFQSQSQSQVTDTETEEDQKSMSLVPSSTPTKKPRKHEYSDRFERFWAAYPKKSGKLGAFKAYRAARDRQDALDEAVVRYRASLDEHGLSAGAIDGERWIKRGRETDDPDEWIRNAARTLNRPDPTQPNIDRKTAGTLIAAKRWAARMKQNGGTA